MEARTFTDYSRIDSEGFVFIPKEVREVLGVANGDRVTFVVDENSVKIANPAVYAMQELQKAMAGEAKRVGWESDEDVVNFIMKMRREENENIY